MTRIAIDIGGTFTDVVAESGDRVATTKLLTSSANPEQAALDAVNAVLGDLSVPIADVESIVHGTTLATNALIERRGARTALVTTAGFRDVVEMRYEKRFDQYALDIELPQPLVPRGLRFGVPERILADGSIHTPLDADAVAALARDLVAAEVEAVAIGFLHAYRTPVHEQQARDILREHLPDDVSICLSSEVAGEIREYERFSTVCANAYVRPLMARYVDKLLSALRDKGFRGSFLMVLSDGALTTADLATRFPIRLVEGGPAGGVALAAHVARETGSDRILSLDIGGTTAKICFIRDGKPQISRLFEVARAWRDTKGSGLPVRIPTVELVEIGAGGGSIARIDTLGRLQAGPKSAGSDPGPAAYDRGGTEPTITDAHLTLGNIDANGFAGGAITLAPDRAPAAIAEHVQRPLGMTALDTAAAGIVELADETMANAARVHGVERGLDVAGFTLLVSGGGGGLHAARIAEKLGIRRIIVPQNAGVGSAVGFLRSPVAFETALSVIQPLDEIDAIALQTRIAQALEEVQAIVAQAAPKGGIVTSAQVELRYQGQGMEIALNLPDPVAPLDLDALTREFKARYQGQLGFTFDDIAVEMVSVSVTAREKQNANVAHEIAVRASEGGATTSRDIFELGAGTRTAHRVTERDALGCTPLAGPAVVTESQTTTLVRPGWSVSRTGQGHLVLERAET